MFQVNHMNTEHILNPPTVSREIVYVKRKQIDNLTNTERQT